MAPQICTECKVPMNAEHKCRCDLPVTDSDGVLWQTRRHYMAMQESMNNNAHLWVDSDDDTGSEYSECSNKTMEY